MPTTSTSLGGLVGFNAGLVGAGALSMVWVPTYKSLAWMWTGFGAGVAVSLPIYLFYAGGTHEVRRGLIFQGTAGTLGLLAGAVFSLDSPDFSMSDGSGLFGSKPNAPIQVTGGGLMPVPGEWASRSPGSCFERLSGESRQKEAGMLGSRRTLCRLSNTSPRKEGPREYSVHKAVTTIGKSLDNDFALPASRVGEHHAQILFDGRDFNLEEVDKSGEILINGKKKRRARLVHGDRLTLGDAELAVQHVRRAERLARTTTAATVPPSATARRPSSPGSASSTSSAKS